jgi:hypothetical protein
MTGALLIESRATGTPATPKGGTILLEVNGTASGADVFAQKSLRSSGSLVLRPAGATVPTFYANGTQKVGILTSSPETSLEVAGSASGRSMHAQDRLASSGVLILRPSAGFGGNGKVSTLMGSGTRVGIMVNSRGLTSTLSASGSFATAQTIMTATGNILAAHQVIFASGSFPITLTLPTAVGISGRQYTIKKVDYSLNNFVTIATTSNQNIDGLSSWILFNRSQELTVVSDGANWKVMNTSVYDVNGYLAMGTTLNQWYTSPVTGTALGTAVLTATSSMRLTPYVVEKVTTIDGMAIAVTATAAGSSVRMGIYRDNGNTYPGKLVTDVGTVTADATGTRSICLSGCTTTPTAGTLPITLQPGLYWLAEHHSAHAITIRGFAVASMNPVMGYASANSTAPNLQYILTQAQAALPTGFPGGATLVTAAPLPAVFVRHLN